MLLRSRALPQQFGIPTSTAASNQSAIGPRDQLGCRPLPNCRTCVGYIPCRNLPCGTHYTILYRIVARRLLPSLGALAKERRCGDVARAAPTTSGSGTGPRYTPHAPPTTNYAAHPTRWPAARALVPASPSGLLQALSHFVTVHCHQVGRAH